MRRNAAAGPGFPADSEEGDDLIATFAELTHGMHCRAIRDIAALASASNLPAAAIGDAVRAYRVGVPDNPWVKPSYAPALPRPTPSCRNGCLDSRTLCSEPSISSNAPRSGSVVHTCVVVQVARGAYCFFGVRPVSARLNWQRPSPRSYSVTRTPTRFDMSEFAAEQNEARLIGAPPGYVRVRCRRRANQRCAITTIPSDPVRRDRKGAPADPRQVLAGPRRRSPHRRPRRDRAFTESIIIFTTNLGIVVPGPATPINNVTVNDPPEVIDAKVREHIEVFFREHLGRPELYKPAQGGVVVFDFLRPDILAQIADASIARALEVAAQRAGRAIELAPAARDAIRQAATADSANGGRGVVSAIETILINPLSRTLFTLQEGRQPLKIIGAMKNGQNWELEID